MNKFELLKRDGLMEARLFEGAQGFHHDFLRKLAASLVLLLLSGLPVFGALKSASQADALSQFNESVQRLVQRVSPSVVQVMVTS